MGHRWLGAAALLLLAAPEMAAAAEAARYRDVHIVSDQAGQARFIDPNLVDPWGLAFNRWGLLWVADGTPGLATTYFPDGYVWSQVKTVASPTSRAATPTGIVRNDSTGFPISGPAGAGPATFLFVTREGTIAGWSSAADPDNAVTVIDHSEAGAVYTGVALGRAYGRDWLFAANFHDGRVEIYGTDFQDAGHFTDPDPALADYGPFGVRNIHGYLYVTFAKQNQPDRNDDVPGPSNGYIDVFTTTGQMIARLVSGGPLDSPWGMALVPDTFEGASDTLLVANSGDGRINAFSLPDGAFLGPLLGPNGAPLTIAGLHGLTFGPRPEATSESDEAALVLFYSANPSPAENGLLGYLEPTGAGPEAAARAPAAGAPVGRMGPYQ